MPMVERHLYSEGNANMPSDVVALKLSELNSTGSHWLHRGCGLMRGSTQSGSSVVI